MLKINSDYDTPGVKCVYELNKFKGSWNALELNKLTSLWCACYDLELILHIIFSYSENVIAAQVMKNNSYSSNKHFSFIRKNPWNACKKIY